MAKPDEVGAPREVGALVVPSTGAVVLRRSGGPSWRPVDAAGVDVDFAARWFSDLHASDYSPATLQTRTLHSHLPALAACAEQAYRGAVQLIAAIPEPLVLAQPAPLGDLP